MNIYLDSNELRAQFKEWVRNLPHEQAYDFSHLYECAIAQFSRACAAIAAFTGAPEDCQRALESRIFGQLHFLVGDEAESSHTFGELYAKL